MSVTRDRIAQDAAIDQQIRVEEAGGNKMEVIREKPYADFMQEYQNSLRREKLLSGADVALVTIDVATPVTRFETRKVKEFYITHEGKSIKVDRTEADRVFEEIIIALNAEYAANLRAKYQDFVSGSNDN